jgi:arylsulfatase A-like enzyme
MMIRFLVIWAAITSSAAAGADRPNILLIFTDDQGINDVGCYGSEIPTPNIDRIAAEGVKFTNFYSASAICTPSRFGLLTGRNPSRSKHQLLSALMFMDDEHKSTGIQPEETTVAEHLGKAGYETALIGKWHLGHGDKSLLPTSHGFDRFIGHTGGCIDFFTMTYGLIPDWYHQEEHVSENGYATELITEEAVKFLNESKDAEEPFFLYLAYNAPHFGKGYSPKDAAPVNLMQPQAADLKRVDFIEDKIRREFAAMTVSLDDGVGKVLETLEETGQSNDTLLIFLTDHGGDPVYGGSNKPFRGDKATLFEGGLRVPCLMRFPGKIEAGTTNDSIAWSIDLFPTFCKLGSAEFDQQLLDGRDLAPTIFEGKPIPDRALFWELGAHAELERKPWSAVRDGDWKYVETPNDGEFLFNLAEDPNEENNRGETDPERLAKFRKYRDYLGEQIRR